MKTADADDDPTPVRILEGADRVRALVDDNFNFIWRYLRGLGVPESEVDDATQQVFVVASQKVASIEPGSERSFLVGTAHGVAANARRADARRRAIRSSPLSIDFWGRSPTTSVPSSFSSSSRG